MTAIRLLTDDGVPLEAEVRMPDGTPRAAAALCHPHPRQGGSKDHPLLWAIRNDLASRGFAVVSFNFRGVLGSGGSYGGGVTETNDARAALDAAAAIVDPPLFACGWSFGANVAFRMAIEDERVGALALIGLPLSESALDLPPLPDRKRLRAFTPPVLLLAGEADPFSPVPELRSLGRRLANATVEVVPDSDHFLWKREREAAAIVGSFAERQLLG